MSQKVKEVCREINNLLNATGITLLVPAYGSKPFYKGNSKGEEHSINIVDYFGNMYACFKVNYTISNYDANPELYSEQALDMLKLEVLKWCIYGKTVDGIQLSLKDAITCATILNNNRRDNPDYYGKN